MKGILEDISYFEEEDKWLYDEEVDKWHSEQYYKGVQELEEWYEKNIDQFQKRRYVDAMSNKEFMEIVEKVRRRSFLDF